MNRFHLAVVGVLAALAVECGAPVIAAAAERTADDVTGTFNQTGRAMPMTVTLTDYNRNLGEVVIRVEKDDTVFVSRGSLESALKDIADAQTLKRLSALAEMIPLKSVNEAGLDIAFDKQKIELVLGLAADKRRDGEVSFAPLAPVASGAVAQPSAISGYLNTFVQSNYLWETEQTAVRFDLEGAVRVGNFVFETEWTIENSVNALVCPAGALCLFDHNGGLKRRGARLVYDILPWQDRLTVGDTRTQPATFQRNPDLLGFSLEHAPTKLDPLKPIRATGAHSFVLERPATVDVLINGAVAQRLHLPPGTHHLRDLPLRAGANDITLLITDDTGASRTLQFNAFSSYALLGAGRSEWSVAAGAPSYFRDGEVAYLKSEFMATAFARYGLTSQLTVEGQVQADQHVVMGGGGGTFGSPFGIWGLQLAASQSDTGILQSGSAAKGTAVVAGGTGVAARLTWERNDISGPDSGDSLQIAAEIHSSGFRMPGQLNVAATGILYPVFDSKMSFSTAYTRRFWGDWQASVTARYDVANEDFVSSNPLVAHGDRYHADFSVTRQVWENATLSGTLGYSNEVYGRSFIGFSDANLSNTKAEVWAGLRFFWRPNAKTFVTASSDTLNERSLVTGSYQSSTGIDSWTTSVTAADDRQTGNGNISGSATYRGQRAEVTVGHDSGLEVFAPGRSGVSIGQQRSNIRVGTALVFAGDKVAISAPVRGDGGFAILSPHASLGDRTILAGTPDSLRAHSDALGPAVVVGMAAYVPQSLPIDVADLPMGYSLGASGFDLLPPYKAGYELQVGSGYSVSALGLLVDEHGEPLALVAGIASNGGKQVTVFTNQAGRFAADGLAAGRWTLVMESDSGPVGYVIDVPEGTQGLLRLGTLTPAKG